MDRRLKPSTHHSHEPRLNVWSTAMANVKKWKSVGEAIGTRESRIKRTVTVHCPIEGKPYDRADFKSHVDRAVGLSHLEAIGPMSQGHMWQLTFDTESNKEAFITQGNFEIKVGLTASVSSNFKRRFYARVHWVPYAVPMQSVVNEFERIEGLTVISAQYTTSSVDGMTHVRSLLRELVFEAENGKTIPHVIKWESGPTRGQALVTVKGRPGVCLKCFEPGHVRQKCPVKFCRACKMHTMLHVTETCPGVTYAQRAGGAGSQLETLPMHELEDDDFLEPTSAEAQPAPTPATPGHAAACIAQAEQATMVTETSAADSVVQAPMQALSTNQLITAVAVCEVSDAHAVTPTHSTKVDEYRDSDDHASGLASHTDAGTDNLEITDRAAELIDGEEATVDVVNSGDEAMTVFPETTLGAIETSEASMNNTSISRRTSEESGETGSALDEVMASQMLTELAVSDSDKENESCAKDTTKRKPNGIVARTKTVARKLKSQIPKQKIIRSMNALQPDDFRKETKRPSPSAKSDASADSKRRIVS